MSTISSQGLVEGSSGIGELIANTLAVRNVTVVVLDVKPIVTENCTSSQTPNNRINELISFCFLLYRQHCVLQVRRVKVGGGRGRVKDDRGGGELD